MSNCTDCRKGLRCKRLGVALDAIIELAGEAYWKRAEEVCIEAATGCADFEEGELCLG